MSDDSTFRRVYLLRHGETLYQPGDHRGEELTERGYAQVEALANLFAGISLDAVYSSPIGRALVTARTISRSSGLPIEVVEALREIRPAIPAGGDRAVAYGQVRAYFTRPDTDWDEPYVGGETFRQLNERVLPFWHELLRRPGWRRVAVVAHYGVNRAILGHVLGRGEPGFVNVDQDFGCVNVVDLAGDRPLLRVLNVTAHDPLKASLESSSADLWYEHAMRSLGQS